MPVLEDEWVKRLAAYYRQSARELLRQAKFLPSVASRARARALLRDIRRILRGLDGYSRWWAEQAIPDWYRTQDFALIKQLRGAKVLTNASFARVNEKAVEELVRTTQAYLETGVKRLRSHVSRLMLKPKFWRAEIGEEIVKGEIMGLSHAKIVARIEDRLVDELSLGKVIVKGDNGVMYHFDMDYYAGMVAHNTRREATTNATKIRAEQNAQDLVVVSENPSTVGDFCDAYRGKVFSLSGKTKGFAPVSRLPNRGTPFHPWCKHVMSIFIARFYSAEQIAAKSKVDRRFLLRKGRTVGDIAKRWKARAA